MTQEVSSQTEKFYDQLSLKMSSSLGNNLHFGYWPGATQFSASDSMEQASHRLTDLLISKIGARSDMHILDLGCGIGGPAIRLAQVTGGQVTGITLSAVQVDLATKLAEANRLGDRIRFQKADAMAMPFEDQSFDTVFALESLCHIIDRGKVFREITRVLRPEGRVVLTDLFQRTPPVAESQDWKAEFQAAIDAASGGAAGPVLGINDYIQVLTNSGLFIREIVDITEESMKKSMRLGCAAGIPQGFMDFVECVGYLLAVGQRA